MSSFLTCAALLIGAYYTGYVVVILDNLLAKLAFITIDRTQKKFSAKLDRLNADEKAEWKKNYDRYNRDGK